jgi:pimeloyl-ACP methyl ester carboxylesterase
MDTLTLHREGSGRTRHRPDRPRRDERRGRSPWSPAVLALVVLAFYPLVSLVLLPESSRSFAARSVTLVLIGAAVAAGLAIARRAPGWFRGTAMLVAGFAATAVTGGVVAKRVASGIGARELTGVLFAAAGVALVVIGWRRGLHGIHRLWARVAVAVVGSLVVAQLALLPAVLAIDATNRPRPAASDRTPAHVGLSYRDVRIMTPDGVRLAAWWVPSRNGAAVLVLPGAGSTRDEVLNHAALVAGEGYGALLLDWRGHGASEGRLHEFGWGAEADVRTAVSWVVRQPGVTQGVGLLGLSMGGEVAVTAAAEDTRVAAVVAEGVSVRTFADARQRSNQWAIPFENDAVMFGLVQLLGSPSPPEPLVDAFKRIGERPVLLIAGNDPSEAELGPLYASAAPETVTLWSLPDTGHIQALSTHPDEYRTRVLSVFDGALLAR